MVCAIAVAAARQTEMKPTTLAKNGPQWFLLRRGPKQERKVADALQAKGYEVFLPMHTVRRQWSDRLKTYDAPLFPGYLFCRFSLTQEKLMVLKTPGVVLIYLGIEKPLPIDRKRVV